ncbi:carboxypeptidase regulatory-like domain-containing protein, partial [Singulisphaera rosea]
KTRDFPRRVLLADHPGLAVGWLVVPDATSSFQGDLILTEPIRRTITVVDSKDRPLEGAIVTALGLGDLSSASPLYRKPLALRVQEGPLTSITDAKGRATLSQLPRTNANFIATKPGFAETYAFPGQTTIRLTPSASLSGTVTGPDGEPLAGIEVVLHTEFLWSFERATSDARGRYRFDGLKARGWDMRAWHAGETGNGMYKIWIDGGKFAIVTQTLTLEPGEPTTLDLQARRAGLIRVTVVEQGTRKPVAGARVWGFDKETGSGARFDATTDELGRATFYSLPTEIHLGVAGPPEGTYLEGAVDDDPGANTAFDFQGGVKHVPLTIPPIAGRLIDLSGICAKPDGSPASGVTVHVATGRFASSSNSSWAHPPRTDDEGRFTLQDVPSGQTLGLYAESEDGQWAGAISFRTEARPDPKARLKIPMRRPLKAGTTLEKTRGAALASREFSVAPKVGEGEFTSLRRTVKSDEQGRIEVDRVIPGLTYHIREVPPILERSVEGMVRRRKPEFDQDLILAPE